uniref:MARVEL domain-containing protein n=1 Tax=Elaeophora elaphi TaxID=1147741 RepID=A0A0R3RQT8_9BILA
MCLSMIGQLMFALIMFVTLILTVAAFLTSGWRSFSVVKGNESEAEKYSMPETMGLLWCTSPLLENSLKIDYCHLWQNNKPRCDEKVSKLMIATLALEVGSLIWVAITFCACCCREFWIFLLPLVAFLTAITLAVALFVYTCNNKTAFDILNESKVAASEAYHVDFSYSYYLAWAALSLVIICILIGAFAKKLAHICC